MKSNLLSGVTPSRVSGSLSISVSKVERILSKRDRREGLRVSSWVSVCFFAISVSGLSTSTKIQFLTGYYKLLPDITQSPRLRSPDPPERSGESWIKIPHRGRSGGVFGTAQGAGYPGVCPGLLGPDLPSLRILLSTTLVNRSGPGAGWGWCIEVPDKLHRSPRVPRGETITFEREKRVRRGSVFLDKLPL